MQPGNISVFGIYATRGQLERAVAELEDAGYRSADISILVPTPNSTKDLGHTNATKAPEGAVLGGGTGAAIGGTLGWLAGLGSIAIPGVGPFIAAGPIMSLLSGVGIGTIIGSLGGALIGLGVPEYEAVRYDSRLKSGGLLLAVHADDDEWAGRARSVLEATGAEDISSKAEVPSGGVRPSAENASTSANEPRTD